MRTRGAPVLSLRADGRAQSYAALARRLRARAGHARCAVPQTPRLNPPLWELGHVGWFQEWWIARNPQRQRGRALPTRTRRALASIAPSADALVRLGQRRRTTRAGSCRCPTRDGTRAVPASTRWRRTLELLRAAPDDGRRRAVLLPPRAVPRRHARRGRATWRRRSASMPRCAGHAGSATRARRAAVRRPSAGRSARAGARLRLRQRARRARGRGARVRDRCAAGDLGAVRRFVEAGGYDEPAGGATTAGPGCGARAGARRATSSSCASGVLQQPLRPADARAAGAAGDARQLARGRCLVPLGRAPPADRSRMGARRASRRRRAASAGATCGSGRRRPFRAVSRVSVADPVPRLFAALVRHAQGAARRVVRDPRAHEAPDATATSIRPHRNDVFAGFRSCPI